MSDANPQIVTGHTRLIVSAILLLSAMALGLGAWLIYKGYESGNMLIQTGGTGISGLLGFLGGKGMAQMVTPPQQPDITVSGSPPRVEVTQPQPEPKHTDP